MESVGWNPWRTLRSRPHLELTWGYLSQGRGRIEEIGRGRRLITLDVRLNRRERSEVCGHELIHDEFDMLWKPGTPKALIESGERFIDRENTERTLPSKVLRDYIDTCLGADLAVTAFDVSEEFDVTVSLAAAALRSLNS